MKRLLFILLLISSIAKAQTDVASKYTHYQYLYGNRTARFWADSILHIPGDTATNAAQNSIAIKGGSFYVKGATKWDLITGSGGTSNKVDSVGIGESLNVDTIKYYINGTAYIAGYLDKKDGLISGGVVTWSGTGLVFDVTAAVYRINGVRYTSSAGSITLSAADPSNPRIDVIGVDNTGAIIKVTGDAASNPIEPQIDPSSQLYLTSVQVNAGATTPSGVSSTTVYDENTEWTITPQGVTANGNNTTNVYKGSKSIDVSSWSNLQQIAFTNGSALNPASYATLKLFVKLKASITGSSNITATFFNGSTAVTNEVNLTGYGLVKNNSTSYQNISIPFTAFTFTNSFDKLRIRFTGTGSGCYIDYVTVQSGVVTQPTVQGLQNAYTVMTDGTNNATSSGSDKFTFRTDNTLSKVVANNDATYGDNILLKVDTTVMTTRAYRQKGLDSLATLIGTTPVETIVKPGNANYTASAATQSIIYETTLTGTRTLTIPSASGNTGIRITIKNAQTADFVVALSSTSSILLNGSAFSQVTKGDWVNIISDGTTWYVVTSTVKIGSGVFVLKQYGLQSTLPNSTSTQTFTYTLPSNTMAKAGDRLQIIMRFKATGGGSDNITVGFATGSTNVISRNSTSFLTTGNEFVIDLVYQGPTTTDLGNLLNSGSLASALTFSSTSLIDWTLANDFNFKFTTGATTTVIPMNVQYIIYKD